MPKPKATEVIATLKAELKDARAEIDRLKKELAGRSTVIKAAKANPDMPVAAIEGILQGMKESRAGLSVPYPMPRLKQDLIPEPVRGSSLRREKAPRPKKGLPPCRPDCRTFHAHIKGTP